VLTHFSDELDSKWALAAAGAAFRGQIELAREGAVFTV
jgi:ribonuclease BN (tRNA processing enzyme)